MRVPVGMRRQAERGAAAAAVLLRLPASMSCWLPALMLLRPFCAEREIVVIKKAMSEKSAIEFTPPLPTRPQHVQRAADAQGNRMDNHNVPWTEPIASTSRVSLRSRFSSRLCTN